jgi:hypothetical protein
MENEVLEATETVQSKAQYMESAELEGIAGAIISEHNLEFGPAEIGYLLVYPNISKSRAAKVLKAPGELKFYTGNDYLVEISGNYGICSMRKPNACWCITNYCRLSRYLRAKPKNG